MGIQQVLEHLKSERERHLQQLAAFLRIPSVSTKSEHAGDIAAAAQWVAEQLGEAGMEQIAIHSTSGHPVVTARSAEQPGAPTVLIYAHYDVQPAEPLELWTTPPFEPTVRNHRLYARGAADDKGQLFLYLKVIEAFSRVEGRQPVNIKVLFEGEEEIGSASLYSFVRRHRKALAADVVLVSDTQMASLQAPSITLGLRGIGCFQIDVRTARADMHSGTFGGAIANPIQVLTDLLAGCKDGKTGRVLIPGFYQQVRPLNATERARVAASAVLDDEAYARAVGAPAVFGERDYSTAERVGARPTFEVNGIWGGYTGEGMKTVLPCEAHAKVSMRLVPDQDPEAIATLFEQHIERLAPPHARVRVQRLENNAPALRVDPEFPELELAARALRQAFGKDPLYRLDGGSVPIVSHLQQTLQAQTLLLGFGLPADNLHAPDESFDLRMLDRGQRTIAIFLDALGGA